LLCRLIKAKSVSDLGTAQPKEVPMRTISYPIETLVEVRLYFTIPLLNGQREFIRTKVDKLKCIKTEGQYIVIYTITTEEGEFKYSHTFDASSVATCIFVHSQAILSKEVRADSEEWYQYKRKTFYAEQLIT